MKWLRGVLVIGLAGGFAEFVNAQELNPPVQVQLAPSRVQLPPGRFVAGDYRSETLVTKAWKALDRKQHNAVWFFTNLCVTSYEETAKEQQASLTALPPRERTFDYWALNDVATAYFILGESLRLQGRYREAREAFERIVADFGFAQCWDPRGWFWRVADGARVRLAVMP